MNKVNNKDLIWEKHRPYIEFISRVNNSCVFVSFLHDKYLYISPNFKDFFGFDKQDSETVEEEGHLLEKCIHPDDISILLDLQKRAFEYVNNLSYEEQSDYKHIFEFRALGAAGKYVRVICQYQILEKRKPEEPLLLLGVVDISPDQDLNAPIKFRLVNFNTGEIIPIPIIEKPDISISKRELEILSMVNEGLFSKEISEKLFISIHTVNRHRQNILQKLSVDNLTEAINYTRKLGLLE